MKKMNVPGAAHLLRLLMLSLVALCGLGFALGLDIHGIEHSALYMYSATALLCFGLYMAVLGIDREKAIQDWRIAALAVTGGVFCKYLLIVGITYYTVHDWRYMVLGMAVAQIDPLSVAALLDDSRMTGRTRTILNLWASFDDPMTVLVTPVLLGIITRQAHQQLAAGQGWVATLLDVAPFAAILLIVGGLALWRRLRSKPQLSLLQRLEEREHLSTAGAVGAIASGVGVRLATIPAIAGLAFRPKWLQGKTGERLTNIALYGATALLGMLLAGGIDLRGGVILGLATYLSQVVVAWLVVCAAQIGQREKLTVRDIWHLALAQQNGITAVVLALNLEPVIPGSVAAISLAIVVVNLVHFAANWAFDALVEPKLQAVPAAAEAEPAPTPNPE